MRQHLPALNFPARRLFGVAALAMLWASLCGCTVDRLSRVLEQASPEVLSIREVPKNPLADTLKLFSKEGPQPTAGTLQLLKRNGLGDSYQNKSRETLAALQKLNQEQPAADKVYAIAELSYIYGCKADKEKDESLALDMYGSSVGHAHFYLFDRRLDPSRNSFNPEFQLARALYNTSLESALRIAKRRGQFLPGRSFQVTSGSHDFDVNVTVKGRWRAEDIERFEFVSDYEVTGLRNSHTSLGLGVPLIAVRTKRTTDDPAERFYPAGLAFPVTAFLHVTDRTRCSSPGCTAHFCELELQDPVDSAALIVNGQPTSMETDLTTPLAYFLNTPILRSNFIGTFGLLDAEAGQQFKGVYMMEPYDPAKIPVVMVHGLWSSPVTWMEMFNDLRSDPEIRKHCQFWFFLYPTGQPFWISAKQFRDELVAVRQTIDPQHQSPALDQMVLIGHSMGGLVSMMQTLESQDDFLRIITDKSFDELKADEPTRKALASTLFFHPNPSIRHVVTIATPHRGSHFANRVTRYAGRNLIQLPKVLVEASNALVRDNPGYFRDTDLLTITTSIDSLAPDSPIFPVMLAAQKSPWTTYHNIVGIDDESFAGVISPNSDGVVPRSSAERPDFASQVVVEADHSHVHTHEHAILEVRRILQVHVGQVCAQWQSQQPATPVGHAQTAPGPQVESSPVLPGLVVPPPSGGRVDPNVQPAAATYSLGG